MVGIHDLIERMDQVKIALFASFASFALNPPARALTKPPDPHPESMTPINADERHKHTSLKYFYLACKRSNSPF